MGDELRRPSAPTSVPAGGGGGEATEPLTLVGRVRERVASWLFLGAGIVHFLGRRPEEAEEAYGVCLSKNPGSEMARLLLGQTLEQQGKWEQAIRMYGELAARDPTYENAYYHRACCLERLGRDEEAMEDCRRAIGVYAKHHAAYVVMGRILLRQGRLDEAGTAVEGAIQIKPKDPAVRELARQVRVALEAARPIFEPDGRKR